MQIGIVPVRLADRRLEIVDDDGLRDAAKVPEGVLQAAKELLRRLVVDHLAVSLAGVTQDHANDMAASAFAIRQQDRGSSAEVHLGLCPWQHLHPSKRHRLTLIQPPSEPPDAVVTATKGVLIDQILIDPLAGQSLLELVGDHRKRKGDDEIGDPEGGRGDGHGPAPDSGGKNFGDDDPDDRSLGHGEEGDEQQGENEDQGPGEELEFKGRAEQGEGDSHPRASGEKHGFPSDPIDEGDGDERKDQVDEADESRLEDGRGSSEPGGFKKAGGVINDGVDPGDLLEHGQENADAQSLPEPGAEQFPNGPAFLGQGLPDRADLR